MKEWCALQLGRPSSARGTINRQEDRFLCVAPTSPQRFRTGRLLGTRWVKIPPSSVLMSQACPSPAPRLSVPAATMYPPSDIF